MLRDQATHTPSVPMADLDAESGDPPVRRVTFL